MASAPAALAAAEASAPASNEPLSGRFHFRDGSVYEGQYRLSGAPQPADTAAAATPAAKKGAGTPTKRPAKDDEPATPAEPPKPLRHGTGVLTCGAYSYSGEWVDDEMNGQGRFTFASGARYEGTLLHNAFHGQGSYCWPDGKQYAGAWVHNVMHGTGVITDTQGHRWTGRFFNGAGPGLTCEL